jgi:hypothetical protein
MRVFQLLAFFSFVHILTFPQIAENVVTHENALRQSFLTSLLQYDKAVEPTFDRIRNEVEKLPTVE